MLEDITKASVDDNPANGVDAIDDFASGKSDDDNDDGDGDGDDGGRDGGSDGDGDNCKDINENDDDDDDDDNTGEGKFGKLGQTEELEVALSATIQVTKDKQLSYETLEN